jgi:hypothetical protein
MLTAFRAGWTRLSTDFPNYYTAAMATRHREPLRSFYDWTWFARQMNYAGIENQLGAYTPQTPLTMLPMMALTSVPPQTAKRVWLTIDLVMLAATIAILARTTAIRWEYLAVLLLCGYPSLRSNFLFGQYYIFLLFFITLALDAFVRKRDDASGFLSGATFALKLYTGPLVLYFAARRAWWSVLGMVAGSAFLGALALSWFGWSDTAYYLTHVLPRTLEGGSIDPYNFGVPALSTLLHKLFMREAELNPNPAFEAPWLFFFLRTAVQLGLVVFATLGLASKSDPDRRHDFAWFLILMVLLSSSTASYTYILLFTPIVLLLRNASLPRSVYLVATYVLMNLNPWPALFSKVWILLLLFFVAGHPYLRAIGWRWVTAAVVAVLLISSADAQHRLYDYQAEPARRYAELAVEPGALFSGYPAITRCGLFFQGMADYRTGRSGYVLRWLHDGHIEWLDFGGNAFHPVANGPGCEIAFELVTHGRSTRMRFDPLTSRAEALPALRSVTVPDTLASPNGKWRVRSRETATSTQLWLEDVAGGRKRELAGGNCNNFSPAWELDSSAVIFASDCGRAFGLPALYRAPVH